MRRLIAALVLTLPGTLVAAPQVLAISLAQGRAELVIDGRTVRSLRDGQVSPEGVALIAATRSSALIEVDGTRHSLGLGETTATSAVLKADRSGHFTTTAYLNGVPVPAMIDTGATAVAFSAELARRLGIDFSRGAPVTIGTAGGAKSGWRVTLARVQVGDIVLANVDTTVVDATAADLPIVLVGMTYLNSVEMQRVGDTLTLTRRR